MPCHRDLESRRYSWRLFRKGLDFIGKAIGFTEKVGESVVITGRILDVSPRPTLGRTTMSKNPRGLLLLAPLLGVRELVRAFGRRGLLLLAPPWECANLFALFVLTSRRPLQSSPPKREQVRALPHYASQKREQVRALPKGAQKSSNTLTRSVLKDKTDSTKG